MKKVGLFLVSLLLTLVTLAGGFPAALPVAYAEGEVPVSICPAYTEVLAGTDFAVSVDIGQVSNLNGGQYDIWYDDQVIEFTGVDNGKIGTTDVPCQSNNWTGHIRVLFSFGFSSVAGSGNLSVIHFKAKNPGYTAVYFSDGLLSNMEANPIPSEWNDGSVQVNSGTPPAQVSIQPAHTTATEGDNFTVAVNVDQVADLNRAEFDILYDDQILEFFGVSDGNIGGTIIPCIFNDLTGGRVHVSGNLTVTTASGSGNISFLHFKTLDAGPSPLSFDSASLYYTNDAEIPASWYNGSVQVNPSGEPQAVPVFINPPHTEILQGTVFSVAASIGQVTDLNSAQFDLWYDDTILEFTGISDGFIGSTVIPGTSNNWTGHIRVVSSLATGSVSGSGNLSVIHFKARNPGYTCVDFSDGLLSSMGAVEIPSTWDNGSVQVNPSGEPQAVPVFINPPQTTIIQGTVFSVAASIGQVTDLNSAQFDLWYDDTIIEFAGISDGFIGGTVIPGTSNNWTGHIRVVSTLATGSVSGSGNLSVIHFKARNPGYTCVDFSDGLLSSIGAVEIPSTWDNGSVQVNPSGEPQAVPVFINPPQTTIIQGTVFSVAASIGQVTDLNSAQFDLWYDDTIIEFAGISDGLIGGTVIPGTSNNWTGHIRVISTLSLGSVSGSGNLSVIHFKARNPGYTSVNFSDGLLSSMGAVPIPAVWNNGSVQVNPSGEPQAVPVFINPPHTEILQGTVFSVAASIGQVTDLNSAQFDLWYDDTIIEFTGISDGLIGGTVIPGTSNNWTGHIRVISTLSLGSVSGSGNLSVIHFKARNPGYTSVNFSDGLLSSMGAVPIPAVWNNGSVQVNPSGEPQAVTISIDPVVTNIFSGNNFDVSVNITEVIDLNSVQYDILFDPAIISLAEVSPGNVGGTAIPVDDNEIDSGHWRVVQYLLGTANGSGYLSKITFHAIQTGQSSINLTDGLVSGFNGPIPANWNPGFVNVGEYVGPELISVNVTPKTNQIYTGGDTVQLTAKAYYDDGSSVDVTADAAWESDNESAATVAAGFVTSEARGTADTVMITATYNGQSDTAEVTTFEPAVTGVTVTPNPAEVSVGKILQFTATASFEFGPDENVTVMAEWSTSNENIATVGTLGNGTPGLVYGEGIGGPITVGAIYGGEAGSASLTVIASALVSVNVTQKTNQIFTGGDTVQLTATAYYENGSSKNVTTDADWSSNNPTIASVGAGTGLVTSGARGTAGTVNISATYNGMLDIARVTTVEPALTGINVIPNPAEVAVDKTLQFTATGSFEFGPNENITNKVDWTSNNTPVATIETVGGSNPGLASGISTGTATIKALLDDQEGTATLTVTEGNIAIVAVNNGAMISLIEGGTAEASSTSGIPVSIIDPGQPVAAAGLVLHYDTRIFTITEAYVSNEAKAAFPSIAATNINNEYDTENHTGRLSIALQNAQTPTEFTSMDVVYFGVNVTGNTGDTSTVMVTVDSLKAPGLVPIEYTAINAPVEILQKVLETITILPENPAVPAGLTIQLSAMGTYNTGTENITDIATWTSSNNSIATVNPQGLVQTLKKGNVNITATMDSVSNTTGLMVLDPLLVNLEVTPEAAEIATGGDTVQLSAIATYTDSSTENVTAEANWTSSNETKAIVVAGLVTSGAKGTAGTATITATYEGKSDTSEITTVEPALTSIEVTPEGAKLSPGFSRQYTATGTYEDQSQKVITTEVQWISSDTTVATTSPDGKVTAVNEGTTSITAKLDQITSDPVTLTVQEMAIVTVNNGETISLAPGSIVEASETTGIPVSIANPGSPIANAGFKLYYDTEIFTITKAYVSTEGKAAFPSLKNTNVNNEYDVDNHIGQLIIALQNTDEPQEFTSMDVVYFGVNVTGNAGDTSVVEITVDTLKTPYMTTIEHTTVNAPVSITSSVAEISSRQMLNKDNIAVVQLSIDRIKAPGSGDTVNLAGGLGSFAGKFTMLDGNMEILKVLPASGFTNMVYDLQAGTFSADAISPDQPNNTPVAELVVKLTGNATDKNHLKVEFTSIKNASGDVDVPGEAPLEMAFLRGDLYDDPTHPDEVNLDDSYVAAMIYLTKFDPSPYLVVNGAGAYHEQGKELGVDLDDSYVLAMRYLTKFDIYFQYVP